MRNKLIDILLEREAVKDANAYDRAESLAGFLLENGVIVPPCKVGQIVYSLNRKALGGHWEDNRYIVDKWDELKVCEIPFSLTLWECGWKGIFLTREEAERALKEVQR